MKILSIPVNDSLHTKIKRAAINNKTTIREYVITATEAKMETQKITDEHKEMLGKELERATFGTDGEEVATFLEDHYDLENLTEKDYDQIMYYLKHFPKKFITNDPEDLLREAGER